MNKFITINKRKIGSSFPPYIIAEMSANHNGDINNAYKIIDMAKAAGADAIKMQTYTADTLTIDSNLPDFQLTDGLWANRSLYDLYQEASTPWDWHKPLFEYAKKIGLTIFSSPFDYSSVDFLESLNTPAYKIASFEAVDLSLISYIAKTGKPLIISTGMADEQEIQEAIDSAKVAGCKNLAILHCVSGYPAPAEDYNLNTIVDMKKRFNLVTGLSDHTIDNATAIAGIALGASIIEKHVTLNRNAGGPDDSFSLESQELEYLCMGAKNAWKAIGNVNYGRKSSEIGNVKFRRSLYVVEDIRAGEVISNYHVRSIRPGYGLAPKYLSSVIGKKVNKDLSRGEALKLEHIVK
jgi:N-acetylneuraminate synthase